MFTVFVEVGQRAFLPRRTSNQEPRYICIDNKVAVSHMARGNSKKNRFTSSELQRSEKSTKQYLIV